MGRLKAKPILVCHFKIYAKKFHAKKPNVMCMLELRWRDTLKKPFIICAAIMLASTTQAHAAFDLICDKMERDGTVTPAGRLLIRDDGSISFFNYSDEIGSYLPIEEAAETTVSEITEDNILIDFTEKAAGKTFQRKMRIDRITGIVSMKASDKQQPDLGKMLCRKTVHAF